MSGTVPPRYGRAVFNLAAIPPGTASFLLCARSSLAFRIAAVRARQKRRRAFRAARKQSSRLLAQRVSVSIPQGYPCCPPHPAPVAPSVQGLRPSAITFVGALSRAVPARGREAVCPPHRLPVFVGVWEPQVSQPLCRQSPPAPTRQTASRPNAPLRSAPYGTGRLAGGHRIKDSADTSVNSRPGHPACKTPSTIGQPGGPRPSLCADASVVPRPEDRKRDINIHQGSSG